jgi:hypothetical protein
LDWRGNVKEKNHVDGKVCGVGRLRVRLKKGRSREEGSLKRQVCVFRTGVVVSGARVSVGVVRGNETQIVNDRDSWVGGARGVRSVMRG